MGTTQTATLKAADLMRTFYNGGSRLTLGALCTKTQGPGPIDLLLRRPSHHMMSHIVDTIEGDNVGEHGVK